MYRINKPKIEKFAEIAKLGEILFHTKDLANLWRIKNENTLYTTISRYIKKKLLFKIYKGFYSIKPIEQIDPFLLGSKAIHEYCYLSAETVLAQAGIIQQSINQITFIGSKRKKFKIEGNTYSVRQLKDEHLYNPAGIINKNHVNIATPNRAIADLLYFNPNAYFDGENLINWKEVRGIQKAIGYPLTTK
ncbi:hypothetical protein ACFL23_01045 [Patescibacteria group bacterium]